MNFESKIIDIFTPGECQQLVEAFDSSAKVPDDFGYSPNSFGIANLSAANRYSLAITEKLFEQITPLLHDRVRFKNSYTREYLTNSSLKLHTDRPGLDFTLSVCIEKPIGLDWPLRVSNSRWLNNHWDNTLPDYNEWTSDSVEFNCLPGQGVFALGRKFPHWRDTFPGTEGQRAVYIFYHWEVI